MKMKLGKNLHVTNGFDHGWDLKELPEQLSCP